MTITGIINKYAPRIIQHDGQTCLAIDRRHITDTDLDFIRTNKQAIIVEIRRLEQEENDREAATITFMSGGWESHAISIDTRKDIDAQIRTAAERFPHDCTVESLRESFDKTVAKSAKAAEEKAAEEKAVAERAAQFEIVEILQNIKPSGGEDGVNGYFLAKYKQASTGEIAIMASCDIFDVGKFSFPKRLEGALDDGEWSETEAACGKWISEFGPFGVGVRM